MKAYKTAIFITSLTGGGAERVVSHIIHRLVELNIPFVLFLMSKKVLYNIPQKTPVIFLGNSSLNEIGIAKLLKIPFVAIKLRHYVIKYKIKTIISFLNRPNYINIISNSIGFSQTKVIISERSFLSQEYGGRTLKSIINNYLIRFLYPRVDLIIANSKGNSRDLNKSYHIHKSKIKTIYNPLNVNYINSIEVDLTYYDRNYINFISIGRLDKNKNMGFLIDVIKKINLSNVRLYIWGEGNEKINLQNKICLNGLQNQIYMMGFHPEPYKFLKGADAFIFSSLSEGFPNVLLEAIACGLPIITNNCKSGPDEILLGEIYSGFNRIITKFGILVPPNDINMFADSIKYFINNRVKFSPSKLDYTKMLSRFNYEAIIKKYINEIM